MSEMVERVARAMADHELPHCGGADGKAFDAAKPNWTFCVAKARAVIAAMREPTEAMKDAVYGRFMSSDPRSAAKFCWCEMIDEALK